MHPWQDGKTRRSMCDEWIWVAGHGKQYDYNVSYYINPETEAAEAVRSEFSYFNYHDEEKWDSCETILSVEQLLGQVYPNEHAVKTILGNTKEDDTQVLEKLRTK